MFGRASLLRTFQIGVMIRKKKADVVRNVSGRLPAYYGFYATFNRRNSYSKIAKLIGLWFSENYDYSTAHGFCPSESCLFAELLV